jgi:glycosyltransferase involved in cell wall biosynthesis
MTPTTPNTLVIVTAHNEAAALGATLEALAVAFPGASVWVADDGSTDATAEIARRGGATVVRSERALGKGGAATLAVRAALERLDPPADAVVLLCDGDLGASAGRLGPLVEAVQGGDGVQTGQGLRAMPTGQAGGEAGRAGGEAGQAGGQAGQAGGEAGRAGGEAGQAGGPADLAVAVFARRVGGGVGLAVGFAHWAIRRRCGLDLRAPISGQRALRVATLRDTLPFAPGFGMEIGMTIDAVRAGHTLVEVELELSHRATGRTLGGFVHRGRQLWHFLRVYRSRR